MIMYRFLYLTQGTTFPTRTLGIGVTSPELARQCDLGNVRGDWTDLFDAVRKEVGINDHDLDAIRDWQGRSLVEIATMGALPPDGTTLAIEHLSLPAIAAAAVLVLRKLGLWPQGDTGRISRERPGMARPLLRVVDIAAHDTHRLSAEWQPRSLPAKDDPWGACCRKPVRAVHGMMCCGMYLEPRSVEEDHLLAAVAAICAEDAILAEAPTPIVARGLQYFRTKTHSRRIWQAALRHEGKSLHDGRPRRRRLVSRTALGMLWRLK
jgi:hypothetical protein